jgi:hypothetical protein
MNDPNMHPISAGLKAVKAQLLAGLPQAEAPLAAWAYICGQRVASVARATHFAEGVLQVQVADDGWRRELTGMAASYVARINQILPPEVRVTRIHFDRPA